MDFCINWWIVKEHARHSFPSSIENASQKRTCQKCARCTLNNKLKAESTYFTQRLSLVWKCIILFVMSLLSALKIFQSITIYLGISYEWTLIIVFHKKKEQKVQIYEVRFFY